jgi:hypothetical protein
MRICHLYSHRSRSLGQSQTLEQYCAVAVDAMPLAGKKMKMGGVALLPLQLVHLTRQYDDVSWSHGTNKECLPRKSWCGYVDFLCLPRRLLTHPFTFAGDSDSQTIS